MARKKSPSKSSRTPKVSPEITTWDERVIRSLLPWRRELFGLLLFILSVITFLALIGLTWSGLLAPWTRFLRQLTGWGAFPLMLMTVLIGLYIMVTRVHLPFAILPSQVVGIELIFLIVLATIHMSFGEGLSGALGGKGGGLIGWALSEPLLDFLGPILLLLFYCVLLLLGIALVSKITWTKLIRGLNRASLNLQLWSNEIDVDLAEREAQRNAHSAAFGQVSQEAIVGTGTIRIDRDELIIVEDTAPAASADENQRDERLPSFDLLEEGAILTLTPEEIDQKKHIIEQTLLDFGLPAEVTEIRRGPAVTQFGVEPGYIERAGPDGEIRPYKVRINQIANLRRDLALALAVSQLRIEAPVPGRGIVGVEVPNSEISLVRLRSILESQTFFDLRSSMAVALGRDVAGVPVTTDLKTLPHLLIAGTTGSGKSVCLNAMIACLAFNNLPDRLRMVMIDPKKVELIRFNGMPHLLGDVETDPDRIVGVLRWLTNEMDRRYEIFAQVGAKQLKDYNRKVSMRHERNQDQKKLPYVAVFIDELADLMVYNPNDVEQTLCRLAQMARATGIHMVVATQRPSTDVITGLIKANFPARASFAVASGTDSRVILDTTGAEHLMGKGDMLYLPPDANAPRRVQGCFVSDREIETIINYWQETIGDTLEEGPQKDEPIQEEKQEAPWEKLITRKAFVSDRDEMLEDAIALAQKYDRLSTSLIQRRLRVGYPRAARLMEALYEMGMVEHPKEGGKTRRTFVDQEQDPLEDFLDQDN